MTWLLEDSLPIWLGGAVVVAMAWIAHAQLRTRNSLCCVWAAILLTVLLLTVEWFVITPREAVTRTLYRAAAAVEANDLPATLVFVAPTARQIRADVDAIMPKVVFSKARVAGDLQVDVDDSADPMTAVATFQALADLTVKKEAVRGTYLDHVEVHLVRDQTGRWLVTDYASQRDWRQAVGRSPSRRRNGDQDAAPLPPSTE